MMTKLKMLLLCIPALALIGCSTDLALHTQSILDCTAQAIIINSGASTTVTTAGDIQKIKDDARIALDKCALIEIGK